MDNGYIGNYRKTHRLRIIWESMMWRCSTTPKHIGAYVKKGIKIAPEFLDFPTFKDYCLSHAYKDGLSIDRIDNKGNYEPGNIQFITRGENNCKDRRVKVNQYDLNGNLLNIYPSLSDAGRAIGKPHGNIHRSCNSNWAAYGFSWKYAGTGVI